MGIRANIMLGRANFLENTRGEKAPADPRTMIILLFMVNIIAFSDKSIFIELITIALLFSLLVYSRCTRIGFILIGMFASIIFLQYYVFPNSLPVFATIFSMLSVYIRKIIPSLMVGSIIIKRIPMSYLILVFRKWRVPERIITILSVTIRYFPAIREESTHIKDAMKLRGIKGFAKIEAYTVPLMLSAINTAEELSAAAVTRGIENPIKKTSSFDIQFSIKDYVFIAAGILLVISTILV